MLSLSADFFYLQSALETWSCWKNFLVQMQKLFSEALQNIWEMNKFSVLRM